MNCDINSSSGRCVNGSKQSPHCKRNPKTKRCVRKNSRTKKAKPKTQPKPKSQAKPAKNYETAGCKEGQIRNPATNRCISVSGATGKKILLTKETNVLGGAVTLDYFEFTFQGVKRRLLSLGDIHTHYDHRKEPNVITLTTFLKKIIRQSDHCIDLFVEDLVYQKQPMIQKNYARGKALRNYQSPLNAVRGEFNQCSKHNIGGHKCPFPNLRYHNWDMRFRTHTPWSSWTADPYDEVFFSVNVDTHKAIKKCDHASVVKYLLGFPLPEANREKIDDIFQEHFIKKAPRYMRGDNGDFGALLDHIKEIEEFKKHHNEIIQESYKKLMKHVKFPKSFLNTFIKSHKRMIMESVTTQSAHVFETVVDYTLIMTDFYMLCRMFQKYDISKRRGPKKCRDSDLAERMILYAGARHNKHIKYFLEEMFGIKPKIFVSQRVTKKITPEMIVYNDYRYPEVKTLGDLIKPFL